MISDVGYFIEKTVLSLSECQQLINIFSPQLKEDKRAGLRHLMSNPKINNIATDPRLIKIAKVFLGKTAYPFRATLFDKSKQTNWLVTWHD